MEKLFQTKGVIVMNVKQSFQLAIKSIFANRLRSSLTMLGIIIGVAAVITLVSIMQGFSDSMVESYENMGVNTLTAYLFPVDQEQKINIEATEEFVSENSDIIVGVSPSISTYDATIAYKDRDDVTQVDGISETYDEINQTELMLGKFFSYLDVKDAKKSCIIGSYIYHTLFNGENPIGKEIRVNGVKLKIQGVLAEMAESFKGTSDDVVLVPYTYIYNIAADASIDILTFSSASRDTSEAAKFAIEEYLRKFYGDYESFSVTSMNETMNEMNNMLSILSAVLVGIASISLIVGGIGIMNIMFVSVTERIKEIGIRTAIGATPMDIMGQFIIEAITTSAIGGMIGIILGIFVSFVSAKIIKIPFTLPISAIIIAVSVSAGIGILFGYLPAKKAALMNPIDALRRE